jgi:DNA-binding response OmpR family regulator
VLVVEDTTAMADALCRGLAAEGCGVEVAADGKEGLRLALDGRFDVIVLDLLLPVMNGYRVCEALRSAGITTPVLVLTAKQGDQDEVEALETGADDFLTKPFSFPVLVARLRALQRRRQTAPHGRLVAGDLALDLGSHRCHRGDEEVTLTPREFTLLAYLMARPDEVIARRELLDDVWDFAFADDSNIVDVYVGYLRRKIDVPFGRQTLETVRGIGYRLNGNGG